MRSTLKIATVLSSLMISGCGVKGSKSISEVFRRDVLREIEVESYKDRSTLSDRAEGWILPLESARRQEIATESGFEPADGEDSDYIRKQCALFFERENIHGFQVLHLSITDNSDAFWIMRKGTRRSILLYFSY